MLPMKRSGEMKFCWCTITVRDLEESLNFYQEVVGLSVTRRFAAEGSTEIAFVGDGGTEVELLYNPEAKVPGMIEGISLGFEVDSVDKMIEFVQSKGIKVVSGPTQPN